MTQTTAPETTTMTDAYARTLTLVAAIGAGLAGGVFLAFSTFIMPALRRIPDRSAMAAMNSINQAAPASPLFMLLLFGTALACLLLGVSAVRRLDQPVARWQLAGCALYLVAVVVTMAYHVPRNDALIALDPNGPNGPAQWRSFVPGWVAWNHVRTVSSVAGTVALAVAVRIG